MGGRAATQTSLRTFLLGSRYRRCWRHFLQLRQATQFWIGVLIYILSFLLVAVVGIRTSAGGPALGYDCEWTTLLYSRELIKWVLDGMQARERSGAWLLMSHPGVGPTVLATDVFLGDQHGSLTAKTWLVMWG